jgi:hypothetical protein
MVDMKFSYHWSIMDQNRNWSEPLQAGARYKQELAARERKHLVPKQGGEQRASSRVSFVTLLTNGASALTRAMR